MTRRGTTPTHKFKATVDLTDAKQIYVTYKQAGKVVLNKTLQSITVEKLQDDPTYESLVTVQLTQFDTLQFVDKYYVDIQVRALYNDGQSIASDILNIPVKGILMDGVIE